MAAAAAEGPEARLEPLVGRMLVTEHVDQFQQGDAIVEGLASSFG